MDEEERKSRAPLEDWLTECLAETLSALWDVDPPATIRALNDITGGIAMIPERSSDDQLSFETQVRIDDGTRPDLVVFCNDIPWIVIESKVSHTASLEQLKGYGDWLCRFRDKAQVDQTDKGCVTFLSFSTRPPEGFNASSSIFSRCNVHVTSWAKAGRILLKEAHGLGADSYARALATAFHRQLEDENMAADYPSSRSLASAEMFMAHGQHIYNLCNEMLEETGQIGDSFRQRTNLAEPCFDQGMYYASRWANNVLASTGATICAGLWFPEGGSFREAVKESMGLAVTESPKAFVTVESEPLMSALTAKCPEGWHRDDQEFLKFADVSEFKGDAEQRAAAIKAWVRDSAKEFVAFISAAE